MQGEVGPSAPATERNFAEREMVRTSAPDAAAGEWGIPPLSLVLKCNKCSDVDWFVSQISQPLNMTADLLPVIIPATNNKRSPFIQHYSICVKTHAHLKEQCGPSLFTSP